MPLNPAPSFKDTNSVELGSQQTNHIDTNSLGESFHDNLQAPKEKNEIGYGLRLLCEAAGLKAPKEKDDSNISSLISFHSHFKKNLTPGSNDPQLSELVSGNIKTVRLHMNKAFSTGSCGGDILRQMKVEWSFVTNLGFININLLNHISNQTKQDLIHLLHQILKQTGDRAKIGDAWRCIANNTSKILKKVYDIFIQDPVLTGFLWTNNKVPDWDTLVPTTGPCVVCLSKTHQINNCDLSTAQSLTTICPKPNSIIHPFDLVKVFMFSNEYNEHGTKPREDTLLKLMSLYDKRDISQEQVWLDEILFYYNGMLRVWELFRYLDREVPQEFYLGPLDIVYENVSQLCYPISQNIYFKFSPNSFCTCNRFCGGICFGLECCCIDDCDISCLNRSTKHQCNNENCNLFISYNKCCSNREISSLISNGPQAGAEFYNTHVTNLGIGLRSTRTYVDGEMIVQYTGVHLKESEYLSLIKKESSTDVS